MALKKAKHSVFNGNKGTYIKYKKKNRKFNFQIFKKEFNFLTQTKNEQLNFGVTQIKKKFDHLTIPVVIVCCEASDVIANVFANFMHLVTYINRFGHEIYET